jgi:hypothetical protein
MTNSKANLHYMSTYLYYGSLRLLHYEHVLTTSLPMKTSISNGSRTNPDNLPVQTRMTPFQIAALKAIASMDGTNSAGLLRSLVDAHIERCLTQAGQDDKELLIGLLKRAGFVPDLERVLSAAIEHEQAAKEHESTIRQESFTRAVDAFVVQTQTPQAPGDN